MRKTPFIPGEFYHIYNRGVDKRNVFDDVHDLNRFLESMRVFNTIKPSGSIFERQFDPIDETPAPSGELVHIVCYCLNPNHYHLLLEEVVENGISEFMKRLGGGYTKYFNEKNKRNGSLFQGRFKSVHIDSDFYLKSLSAYINLNNLVHKIASRLYRSSWGEYINGNGTKKDKDEQMCFKGIILDGFSNFAKYEIFAKETVAGIIERRDEAKEKGGREGRKDLREFFLE